MTPTETLKQRRNTILKELSEPISTEAYFIGIAAMCAAGEDTYEKRQAIFKETYERQMSAWMNDDASFLLDQDGLQYSPTTGIAATRKNRRKEVDSDIQRFIEIAKK